MRRCGRTPAEIEEDIVLLAPQAEAVRIDGGDTGVLLRTRFSYSLPPAVRLAIAFEISCWIANTSAASRS